ncbi:MAG: hypothetical protein QM504_07995 [Pseudomonadota bacterium]
MLSLDESEIVRIIENNIENCRYCPAGLIINFINYLSKKRGVAVTHVNEMVEKIKEHLSDMVLIE